MALAVALIALATGVVAVVVAMGASSRPVSSSAPSLKNQPTTNAKISTTASSSAPSYNSQQTVDAKNSLCTTYASVKKAVVENTHLTSPGDDPVGKLAVAANARVALFGGGQYLRDRLAAEPAAPPDLANALTSMANTLENLGISYLSGASDSVTDHLRDALNSDIAQLDRMCA